MHRTTAARARWAEIYRSIDDDVDGMLGAVTARAEAQMLRLQVAYALLDATADIDVDPRRRRARRLGLLRTIGRNHLG